jgi:hypothetical protein
MAFDHQLFRDDVSTPLAVTVRPATVVGRYGYKIHYPMSDAAYTYPDVCDLRFDHRPDEVSRGHFTEGVKPIQASQREEH